jgi:hypothetical protein
MPGLNAKAIFLVAGGLCVAAGLAIGIWVCASNRPVDPSPPPTGPVLFEECSERLNLVFKHDAGPLPHDGKYFMPQIMGSGAGIYYEADTLYVVLLSNGGPKSASTNRLFRQSRDGRFVDVTAGSGLDFAGHNMGVAIADVNNDGLPDILVTQFGGLKLLLNHGNGKFTDVTSAAGLDSPLWGTSAAFFDFDRDGYLDLVVVNYLEYDPTRPCNRDGRAYDYCPPYVFNKQVAKLFHNVSADDPEGGVHFEDVTLSSGIGKLAGTGLGVVALDFTGDGWPDLFVANDAYANFLWVNQRDGTFREEAVQRGLAFNRLGQAQANMGIAFADVAGRGMFDLVVTHERAEYHVLYRQGPRGLFQDYSSQAGITQSAWRATGFGVALADLDNDGFPDLALVNGKVQAGKLVRDKHIDPATFWDDYAERNQLFLNDRNGAFVDVSEANSAFCGASAVSRGLVWLDFDGDGAIDLLVTTVAGPARLFRNVAPSKGHWLMVRAIDPSLGGRDAIGAEITLELGSKKKLGWINPAGSYLCSSDPRAHFGLGAADKVDAVRVLWPDGTAEVFTPEGIDRVVVVRKGAGKKP